MADHSAQIRSLGSLGYSPERIADLLGIPRHDRADFLCRLTTEDDPYHTAYASGFAIGQYNVDAELAKKAERGDEDCVKLLDERKKERYINGLKSKLFGI
jgi:hypothetical protein